MPEIPRPEALRACLNLRHAGSLNDQLPIRAYKHKMMPYETAEGWQLDLHSDKIWEVMHMLSGGTRASTTSLSRFYIQILFTSARKRARDRPLISSINDPPHRANFQADVRSVRRAVLRPHLLQPNGMTILDETQHPTCMSLCTVAGMTIMTLAFHNVAQTSIGKACYNIMHISPCCVPNELKQVLPP